jgi:hypothetical protein
MKKLIALFALAASVTLAAPPNTPVLDGRPIEYDDVELVGFNPALANNFGAGNVITNLFVTWDAEFLYIALQGAENDNKLTIMLDVDPGNGTGASTTTNWSNVDPSFIKFNDVGWRASDEVSATAFGLDYMIASEGFFNNILRINYDGDVLADTNDVVAIFDSGNGSSPQGGPVDMVVLADGSACPLKGIEARIAWTNLYDSSGRFGSVSPGETVPVGASLRLFAVLHNNDPTSAFSSDGIIPEQTSVNAGYAAGIWTTDDYVEISVDGDDDGLPDLGTGDVNAPYLKFVTGVQGKRQVFAWFNEDVTPITAEGAANWLVGVDTPVSATLVQSDAVLLTLSNDLPAAGTLINITASEVEDLASNSKTTFLCLDPAASGLETSVTVRFLLNKNSGMGFSTANPRVTTNLFINGGAAPLEFGFPPSMSSPLIMLNSTQYYRDVTFPPGTSERISYKYSGILDGGSQASGTNNYEAVRLVDYADAARWLTLPTNGLVTDLVVTDWLGAVAAPFRDPNTNTGFNAVYTDARRGDAGVRQRTTMLFQLDLSQRNQAGITRVLVMGSDPLRGFNNTSSSIDDFPGGLGWTQGGIELNDDGLLGDETASDGIYSRLWSFSTDGIDSITEPEFPNSLVGGGDFTPPYFGAWLDRRSPKSIVYKYAIYKGGTDEALESPAADIEYYIEGSPTNITLDPFLWDNAGLPLPPPSNAPTLVSVLFTQNQARAVFSNQVTELQHGFEIATNLVQGWLDYGSRAVTTSVAGIWEARVNEVNASEHYRAFAGPPKPFVGVWADPYPIPATGATVRIYYTQHSRMLAGNRNVQIAGNWTSWAPLPMTFLGDGVWYYDLVANTSVFPNTEIKFKPRDLAGANWDGMGGGGNDFFLYLGDLRASFSNPNPTNGELLTITYDANSGPLSNSVAINAYVGFDEFWNDAGPRAMTNTLGETNIWELTFPIPTTTVLSVNMVFNNGTTWDSESAAPPNGRQWRLFLEQPE